MSTQKTKTNDDAEVSGVIASAGAGTTSTGTDVPVRGHKLRRTNPKVAAGVAHRTKKAKTRTPRASKAGSANAKTDGGQSGKLSALDAAARVLQEAGQPMNCNDMIQAMASQAYWTSPAGKTPSATLYSAILRETKTKGSQARFQKTTRGHFVYHSPQAS
jgi:hypothetical protein